MARSAAHSIVDMIDEIDWATALLASRTYEVFEGERAAGRAVERAIEIISEASRRLPESLTASHPDIPWRAVAPIGDILRHEYHTTSAKIVWDVVQNDLPTLRTALDDMRGRLATG